MKLEIRILLALVVAGSAMAEDAVRDLGSTSVTASRTHSGIGNAPHTIGILDADQLDLERTIPEALGEVSGVLVQKTTHGQGSPFIRGFTGRQNLLLVDGIRINNSTFRSGPIQYWNTLDAEAVDRLELVKGSGSVLYGSDSIGGTLNVFSKSVGFRDQTGNFQFGEASYKYDTNGGSHRARIEQGFGKGGSWGVLLGIGAKDYGDIRDGGSIGRLQRTGYTEKTFDVKFEYAVSEDATFTFAHQYLNQDDVWRWHSTIFSDPDGDGVSWRSGDVFTTAGSDLSRVLDQERALTYAKFEHELEGSFINRYSTTLSYQKSQDSQDRVRSSGRNDVNVADVETFGLSFVAESGLKKGNLVWGVDFYQDEIDTQGFRNGAFRAGNLPVADDSRYQSLGAFGQYVIDLTDKTELTIGSRYTYAKAEWENNANTASNNAGLRGEDSFDDVSFSVRVNHDLTKSVRLYGGVSEAFRAPNLDDLTGSQQALSGSNTTGFADVKPEKVLNSELGLQYSDDNYRFNAATYYTYIDNIVTRVPIDGTPNQSDLQSVNAEEGYLYGVELDFRWFINDNLEFEARASWQDGKIERPDFIGGPIDEDTVNRLAPLQGAVSLKWTSSNDKLWVKGQIIAAQKQDNLSDTFAPRDTQRIPVGGTPGYVVGSLYAGYELNHKTSLTLGLENIGDVDYRVHGSGVNQPGINAILGVKYRW